MKKLLALLLLVPFSASSMTLWDWYSGKLPTVAERTPIFQSFFPNEIYRGAKEQNIRFLDALMGIHGESIESEEIILGAQNAVGGRVYALSGSGVSSSQTTINLTSFKIVGGDTKLAMTDFGTLGCGTIEPGNATRQEFVSFTGVTQNSDGTAQLTGVSRGLKPIPDYTASTTLQRAHSGGSQFVISNSPPCFYEAYANRTASTTITARYFFDVAPELSAHVGTATTSTQFATKQYVDNSVSQGAATSTESRGGLVELATLAEQANSYDGGVNQPTTIQTKNSTSTCQVVGSYNIVASSTSGKLDKNCFDQTANYNLTGTIGVGTSSPYAKLGVQGGISASGTTTVDNLNIASSTGLHSNGTNISIAQGVGMGYMPLTIYKNFNVASSTTANATTTLSTYRIPANLLIADSKLEIDTSWSATSGSGCGFDVRFGNGTATTSMAFGGYDASGTTNALVLGANTKIYVVSSSQQYSSSVTTYSKANSAYPRIAGQSTSHTETLTGVTYIDWVAKAPGANNTCMLNGYAITLTQ